VPSACGSISIFDHIGPDVMGQWFPWSSSLLSLPLFFSRYGFCRKSLAEHWPVCIPPTTRASPSFLRGCWHVFVGELIGIVPL
jgi:hypothetical protein